MWVNFWTLKRFFFIFFIFLSYSIYLRFFVMHTKLKFNLVKTLIHVYTPYCGDSAFPALPTVWLFCSFWHKKIIVHPRLYNNMRWVDELLLKNLWLPTVMMKISINKIGTTSVPNDLGSPLLNKSKVSERHTGRYVDMTKSMNTQRVSLEVLECIKFCRYFVSFDFQLAKHTNCCCLWASTMTAMWMIRVMRS